MRTCLLIATVAGLCAGARAEHNAPPAREPLRVVAFYSSTCQHCYKAKKALADSRKRWGERIRIEHRDMKDLKPFVQMLAYDEHYGAKAQAPPKVFVGGQYLEGYPAIAKRLDAVIAEELAKGAVTFEPAAGAAPSTQATRCEADERAAFGALERRFETFGPGAVAAAGLLDGVNPCAFTTIVFLLSMLAHLGKSRRDLAVVGVGFTAAVFVMYFLLGLGAWGVLEGIKAYSVGSGISTVLAYGVACLTLALAAWSFVDFVRYLRSGDVKTVTLGLPGSIKQRIHRVIRVGLSTRGLAVGSVAVGVLVALLESVCTGQVYLPTIVFVVRAPG